ncbi:LOW QUALITY PROTEIN: hypothetical protein KUTeg_006724 [Tegillarca granosa]|uniref:Uncharacterized protein n=1 Tax=Tegillarca granosa TaxID=220873 RepID=A0ABQ9FB48_TEGGR|nr:LOW QUALITY PROTEIN: hypothetical protein KUTeg_006724 [Tegillarca granosa]
MVLALLEATQKDSSVFILNISDVTILHLIVCLGLKNCLLEILKSKSVPSVTLQQLNLNLLLLATITGKADIAKVLLENGWSAKDCITESPISLADVSSVYGHDKVLKLLIEHGVDIYKTSKDNHSSLCLSKEYPKEVVKLLFNQTVDECKFVFCLTPLCISSRYSHVEEAKLLLKHGADINLCDMYDQTPLHISSEYGHVEMVKLLLSHGADINKYDKKGLTPLHLSSKNGHVEKVELLLNHGAEIDTNGLTPLYLSCEGGHVEVAKLLLSHGADINKCKANGRTPLHISCVRGNVEVVKLLLLMERKLTQKALHLFTYHVKGGHVEVAKLLLSHGAEIDTKGPTPPYLSCEGGHDGHGAEIDTKGPTPPYLSCEGGHVEVAESFLSHGAEIDTKGLTPPYLSCEGGFAKAIKLLVGHRAEIDTKGRAPFNLSCERGYDKVPKLLLGRRVDIDKSKTNGLTPLHVSCVRGHVKVVELLLRYGADKNKCDTNGFTPLHVASKYGHNEIMDLLRRHNSNYHSFKFLRPLGFTYSYLLTSSEWGHITAIHSLMRRKMDINKCSKLAFTPIHVSSSDGISPLHVSEGVLVEGLNLLLNTFKEILTDISVACEEMLSNNELSYGHNILSNINSFMSDRAKVNISFTELLEQYKTEILSTMKDGWTDLTDNQKMLCSKVNNFFCSLHLMVNMAECASPILKKFEKMNVSPSDDDISDEDDDDSNMIPSSEARVMTLLRFCSKCFSCGGDENQVCIKFFHSFYLTSVKLLLCHGVVSNKCDTGGRTPLHLSSEGGRVEVVKLLLSHEADSNKCITDGLTPLHLSSKDGHVEIVELLLSHGADKNKCDTDGRTSLHLSSEGVEIVELLQSHAADNQCDLASRTPLSILS